MTKVALPGSMDGVDGKHEKWTSGEGLVDPDGNPIASPESPVHGSVPYYDSATSKWTHIPPGAAGTVLQSQGSGEDPAYALGGGSGGGGGGVPWLGLGKEDNLADYPARHVGEMAWLNAHRLPGVGPGYIRPLASAGYSDQGLIMWISPDGPLFDPDLVHQIGMQARMSSPVPSIYDIELTLKSEWNVAPPEDHYTYLSHVFFDKTNLYINHNPFTGSAKGAAASTTITGVGTLFRSEVRPGQYVQVGNQGRIVRQILSDSLLELQDPLTTGTTEVQAGTVSVGIGSATVTGSGTNFGKLWKGETLLIAGEEHVIQSILSNTNLTLATPHVAGSGGFVTFSRTSRIMSPWRKPDMYMIGCRVYYDYLTQTVKEVDFFVFTDKKYHKTGIAPGVGSYQDHWYGPLRTETGSSLSGGATGNPYADSYYHYQGPDLHTCLWGAGAVQKIAIPGSLPEIRLRMKTTVEQLELDPDAGPEEYTGGTQRLTFGYHDGAAWKHLKSFAIKGMNLGWNLESQGPPQPDPGSIPDWLYWTHEVPAGEHGHVPHIEFGQISTTYSGSAIFKNLKWLPEATEYADKPAFPLSPPP